MSPVFGVFDKVRHKPACAAKEVSKKFWILEEIIRIYHDFVDMIDNSGPRVTAWHYEALPSGAKQ